MTLRWLTAVGVSIAVILSAPFMGQLRAALRTAFPRHFVIIVGGAVAVAFVAGVAVALFRIRDCRRLRYGAIAAAFLAAFAYTPDSERVRRK